MSEIVIRSSYYQCILLFFVFFLYTVVIHTRSVHRTKDPLQPSITVHLVGCTQEYTLHNWHLEEYPFFKLFDQAFFNNHLLPQGPITIRNKPTITIEGNTLTALIEKLLLEINQKKKKYTDFLVLQNKGFNRGKGCGLLIVKFKEHPFVLKLFIETPESFVNPWAKGFEPIFFLYMGGGVNRHLAGFTRIKNLEYIKGRIASDPQWASMVDTPRKWFWLPKESSWLEIIGTNIGTQLTQKKSIPAVYGIVADAIEAERSFSSFNKKDTSVALQLTNFLEANLDLHITNFMVEKETKKVVIIDTEHFPTMIGLKDERPTFDGYISWLCYLINKCAQDMLFSTKQTRINAQHITVDSLAPCYAIAPENRGDTRPVAQLS